MHILQVINSLKIGGAEHLLSELVPILNEKHHVEILMLQQFGTVFEKQLRDAGITIHCLGVKHLYNPFNIWRIRHFLKQHPQFGILHVHLFPSLYWVALASIGLNKKLVWTEHSTTNKRAQKFYLQPIERFVYSLYDKIICISSATLHSVRNWTKATPDDTRYCTIENGIDTTRFGKSDEPSPYPHTLIQVSRFEASKDQDTMIRAMTLLPQDVHLLLVGDGTRLDECKRLSEELKVQERVHFLGARTDISHLLSSADISIQSSHWEGFGLTAVEAMATGLPVVASDVDGLKQVVEGAGILFPQGNAEVLAQHVNRLLSENTLYEEVAQACYERAQHYDIHTMADRYIRVYEEVLSLHP